MIDVSLYPLYELARGNNAIWQYVKKVEYAPKDSSAWNDLGKILSNTRYFRQAIRCFDESIELDESNVDAWINKGKCFFELAMYQDSLACFDVVTLKLDESNVDAWINKGNIKFSLKSYEEALACYDSALKYNNQSKSNDSGKQNEDNSVIYYKKANCLYYLRRDDEAVNCYSISINLDPKKPIPYINRGLTFNRQGKYKEAEQDYKKALKLDPGNIAALRNLSYLYSDSKYEYDKALEYCRKLYEANPNIEWTTYLAETYIKAQKYDLARIYSKKALEKKIGKEDILYESINKFFIVCSHLLGGDIDIGREELRNFLHYWEKLGGTFNIEESKWVFKGLEQAISDNEADPQVKLILMNLIKLLKGNKDSLRQLREQMKDLNKKKNKSQNVTGAIDELLGNIRTNEKRLEQKGYNVNYLDMDEQATENILPELKTLRENTEKLKTISQVLKIDIDLPHETNLHLAHLMIIEGKYEEALDIYDRILEKEPKNLNALINKGVTLFRLGEYEEARKYYDSVLSINSSNIEAIVNLGVLLDQMGEREEAESYYQKATRLEPDEKNFEDHLYRGIALNNLKKYEEAILCFDRGLKINPIHDRLLVNMGISLAALGKYEEARAYYDQALKNNPRSVLALYNKACSFSLDGNKSEALQYLKEAVMLNPRFKDLARQDDDFKDLRGEEMFAAITAPV